MKQNQVDYLGVRIDLGFNLKNISSEINRIIKQGSGKIYTINPEFIVDSYFDSNFRKELNCGDLNLIDGNGLLYGVKKYLSKDTDKSAINSTKVTPGVDLVDIILDIADYKELSVFVLGGNPTYSSAEKAVEVIQRKFPRAKLIGASSSFSYETKDDEASLNYIKKCLKNHSLQELDILLVGYGHKNQEIWIGRNSDKIPARLSIGVGGTIDYMSGAVTRAPKFMRSLGLEWLYRLITQPKRFLRVIKATILFLDLSRRFYSK